MKCKQWVALTCRMGQLSNKWVTRLAQSRAESILIVGSRRIVKACWSLSLAPEDRDGGRNCTRRSRRRAAFYDKLLSRPISVPPLFPSAAPLLSDASLHSEWVMTELRHARKAQRQSGQRKLFPVRLVDMETLREWECFNADSSKDRSPTRQLPYSPPPPRASSCANTPTPTSPLEGSRALRDRLRPPAQRPSC